MNTINHLHVVGAAILPAATGELGPVGPAGIGANFYLQIKGEVALSRPTKKDGLDRPDHPVPRVSAAFVDAVVETQNGLAWAEMH